jgi:hypothetical protein
VQRDLRAYIAKHSPRTIPVGYSAADVREILEDTWNYLQCGGNSTTDASRSELFGLNSYSWCGAEATYTSAGYDQLVGMFGNSSVPVFFSEYGCNKPSGIPRVFNEVQALYGTKMTSLSGGLVYEYSQEESDYGLVVINGNGTVTLRSDYDNLQGQYNKLDVKLLENSAATESATTAPECSPDLITSNEFSTTWVLPDQPDGAADLINNGISNPNSGNIVKVNNLDVNIPIYSVSGARLTGIKVTVRDDANTPGGQNTSGTATTTTTSSSATPSTTKKAAAVKVGVDILGFVVMAAAACLIL